MSTTTTAAEVAHQVERRVLGRMLIDPAVAERVLSELTVDVFVTPSHRDLFSLIQAHLADGRLANMQTLAAHWKPGAAGLAELTLVADPHLGDNLRQLREFTAVREARVRLSEGLDALDGFRGGAGSAETFAAISEAAGQALSALDLEASDRPVRTVGEVGEAFLTEFEERRENPGHRAIKTGLPSLDRMMGGWRAGQLSVVAARTSVGKSLALAQFAMHAAENRWEHLGRKARVLVFTLEMSGEDLVERATSAATDIDGDSLLTARVSDGQAEEVRRYVQGLRELPNYRIDDRPNQTANSIRLRCRREHADGGLDMVVVDYLTLVQIPDARQRYVAVGNLTKALKRLAGELKVPVVIAAQLNRQAEDRNEPTLRDLRESGDVEQDVDIALFLHLLPKEEADLPEGVTRPTWGGKEELPKMRVIVAKNRRGPKGRIECQADYAHSRIKEMAFEPEVV